MRNKSVALVAGFTFAAVALAGCGSDTKEAAKAGAEVGPPGSACPMPVTFSTADKWKADVAEQDFTTGGVKLLCEIDAKPAGSVGFIRVWQAAGVTDAKAALEKFTSGEIGRDQKYTAGPLSGSEVEYVKGSDSPARALAVPAGGGIVVVSVGALSKDLFEKNLPAYELVKSGIKATA
ncbi:lipoprotein [Amycolatopsis sp.]|jgi:hypothetical protein|uniref:lipoprotein n=1 Tax=Amycolatopsis sp. TaxID=37632 RepID=UPI002E0B8791|nr:lipoprotein [Amycolatopsis sp.]